MTTTKITFTPETTCASKPARPSLSTTQRAVLGAAARRGDELAFPLPASLPLAGAAVTRTLVSLLKRGLIAQVATAPGEPAWREGPAGGRLTLRITPAGLAAIGSGRRGEEPAADEQGTRNEDRAADSDHARSGTAVEKAAGQGSWPRPGSKQAVLVALLGRADGATLAELRAATGWLPHRVRAALTGLRRRGLAVARAAA